jgi:hypothetical protein
VTESAERVVALVEGMRHAIEAFEAGRLTIDRLSWELKSRLAALDEIADPAWVEELRSIRNQLEVVSAFFIESGRSTLTDEERAEVESAVHNIQVALGHVDTET